MERGRELLLHVLPSVGVPPERLDTMLGDRSSTGCSCKQGSFNSTHDILRIVIYDVSMASSISENATFLRVVVRKDFLKTIQDYRFAKRFDSVSDAVRALFGHGLLAEGFVKPEDGVPPTSPFPGGAPEITDGKLVGWSLEM